MSEKKMITAALCMLAMVATWSHADTLAGLADVNVVDGEIVSLQYGGIDYVAAAGDLLLGTTTRWYVDANGVETLWAEGDPAPPATVSGTSNPKVNDVGSNADNFVFAGSGVEGGMSSIDGIDFQETLFAVPSDTFFLFERGGNDAGIWQAILADGSLGAEVAFDKTANGGPYADTGVSAGGQNAYGVVFKTDVPVQGVRITASGHDTLSISALAPEPIPVATLAELEAAAAAAGYGDRILLAEGVYYLTSRIEIQSGVTYRGAGADLTIIDCNGLTRAFTAWGDRSASGQVDANGIEIPNRTGPTGWLIDGLTMQNGVTEDEDNGADLSDDGAAICLLNGASGTVRNCSIVDCSAVDDGGAFYADSAASLRVENCSIAGTSCGDDGGVFRIDGAASIEVDRCLIVDCLAVDQGGVGSLSSDDSFFSLTRCIIDNVDADDDGAVFRSGGSGSRGLLMANCIIMNCDAADDNVIWMRGASNRILNCTFVNNTCGDKGIIGEETDEAHAGAENVIVNNIFVGNSNAGSGDDFINQRTDPVTQPVTVTNNLFFQNLTDTGEIGLGVVIGTDGNVESDPLFLAPDDFRMAGAESPAVDGGTDVGLTEDIDGNARPQGHATDIGAYESPFTRDAGQ
jgi:hypothetical protein